MFLRRLKRAIYQLPTVRWVVGRVVDRQFRKWKRASPVGTFAEFYSHRIERKIRAGKYHKTLGARGWQPGHGPGLEFDRRSFATRGLENWAQILSFGLRPEMRCVDYGCGSLRLGQHAMRYLDDGNYWGIDVTDVFITEGMKLIDPELIAKRNPRFGTINHNLLAEVREWKPEFIFANAVLVHVPPRELQLFFKRLDSIMTAESKAVIIYIASYRTMRLKPMNWAYPEAVLEQAARAAGVTSKIAFENVVDEPRFVDGRPRRALLLNGPSGQTAQGEIVSIRAAPSVRWT